MVKRCHLIGVNGIPNQVLEVNQSLVIGRNRQCRIRDIACSRSHCSATFDGNVLLVDYTKVNKRHNLSSGQTLSGTGFQYKIVFVEDGDETDGQQTCDTPGEAQPVQEVAETVIDDGKNQSTETSWEVLFGGHVHICRFLGGGRSSRSIAAFDFDGTLVDTKSGKKYAMDSDDWRLLDKSLPKRIVKLVEENGYRFVVISNQLPISQGRTKAEDIYHRFESALTAIGVPCLVMLAAFDDIYRKPRPGLWQLLADKFNDQKIDLTTSFFVGDAAGRKKQLNGKSDHSLADLLFAANSDIPFLTPERFLSDVKPKSWDSTKTSYSGLSISTFRPKASDDSFIASQLGTNRRFQSIKQLLEPYAHKLHTIVFCGLAASGKSSFFANHLKPLGYSYISRDELKTVEKCHKKCVTNLQNKTNCVIDNTNVDVQSRRQWAELCRKHSAVALLFHFDVSVEQTLHNNIFRRVIGVNSPVTELVIRSQNKNFVKPTLNEGFEGVFKINFVPKFSSEEHRMLYFMYLFER